MALYLRFKGGLTKLGTHIICDFCGKRIYHSCGDGRYLYVKTNSKYTPISDHKRDLCESCHDDIFKLFGPLYEKTVMETYYSIVDRDKNRVNN